MTRITHTQRKILENVAAGRNAMAGRPSGRSAAGGWDGSVWSCQRRGWLIYSPTSGSYVITEAGRDFLRAKGATNE